MAISKSRSSALPRRASFGLVVVGVLCGACGGSRDTEIPPASDGDAPARAGASERSVCSGCPGLAGGESSDFGGGTPHPCVRFERPTAINEARAIELGFDMARLTALIEREIDAPLRWTASDTNRGGAPKGYEPQTRIEGRASRGDWLTHIALDPEHCVGTTCRDNQVGEWTCSDRLELGVEVELRTLDGALHAAASGYVLQGREGFSFETPAGSQHADLRDVTGRLELFPPKNPPIQLALLMVDLFFEADQIKGDARAYFQLSARPGAAEHYSPLSGHWPDVPSGSEEPARGSPETLEELEP